MAGDYLDNRICTEWDSGYKVGMGVRRRPCIMCCFPQRETYPVPKSASLPPEDPLWIYCDNYTRSAG